MEVKSTWHNGDEVIAVVEYPNGKYAVEYGYDEERGDGDSIAGWFLTIEEAEATLLRQRPQATTDWPRSVPVERLDWADAQNQLYGFPIEELTAGEKQALVDRAAELYSLRIDSEMEDARCECLTEAFGEICDKEHGWE